MLRCHMCTHKVITWNSQVFRIFKLARVLKLARHSPGLQVVSKTLYFQKLEYILEADVNLLCRRLFTHCDRVTRSSASLSSWSASVGSSLQGGFAKYLAVEPNLESKKELQSYLPPASSLCFFIEIEEESGFTSIPTAFYWVVVTMTTVDCRR